MTQPGNDEVVGYEMCEENDGPGGEDADNVWHYFHPRCYEQWTKAKRKSGLVPGDVERELSYDEALMEEYVCDWCQALLSDEPQTAGNFIEEQDDDE